MNAAAARRHLSHDPDQMPDLIGSPSALSIMSDHWFVFRGSLNGGEFRCGCGLSFLNAHELGVHVKIARAAAIPFGDETNPGGA